LCKVQGIKHDAVELHRPLAGCFERRDPSSMGVKQPLQRSKSPERYGQ
jgi:hypothetical protein